MLCIHFIMRIARVCPLFTGPVITRERLVLGTSEPPWSDAASTERQLWGKGT